MRVVSLTSANGEHHAEIRLDDQGTQAWEDGQCIRTAGGDRLDEWVGDYESQGWTRD